LPSSGSKWAIQTSKPNTVNRRKQSPIFMISPGLGIDLTGGIVTGVINQSKHKVGFATLAQPRSSVTKNLASAFTDIKFSD
jgi:hypothetical protein